ncbi:MATE family efflux transporter [Halogranum rubrum]|uniref:Multidrug-efflux transporter n=1 Tax=Halogranum salarium B-1 TaxID=1210908 RepID=J3A4P1_9EURY|nr:MATE family efflux transporter [Halogranum salarium]EJN60438.1 efflux protein, mate family [Halogranum salarium B-1]
MSSLPNPFRRLIVSIGLVLAHFGLVDRERAIRTADLSWPRIVTGIARMSKNAVDVAMVGIVAGVPAITGVGIAGPYWGLAFSLGGGVAGGTIALVSQRFGADDSGGIDRAVRGSVVLVVAASLPVTLAFWAFPTELISLISDDAAAVGFGATYLGIVGFGVPFAGLNLVGSRVLVGSDDAYTAMILRASGALINIGLNALFIFGLGWGIAGAAAGTVLSNVIVTCAFAFGLVRGRLPGVGALPVQIDPVGSYFHLDTLRDLVSIGLPVMGRNLVWTIAEFPMLAILSTMGSAVVAAFVVTRRIWGIMNTPGWGFGLASSSLVGQALGTGDEEIAETYGREVIRFAVATYLVSAVVVATFARPIVSAFNPSPEAFPIAVSLVYVACIAVVFQGVSGGAAGPLDASGDTRWAFASQFVGMLCSILFAFLGASVSAVGLVGLYFAFLAETSIPAALNYYRFRTGAWKVVSRNYRPGATAADD